MAPRRGRRGKPKLHRRDRPSLWIRPNLQNQVGFGEEKVRRAVQKVTGITRRQVNGYTMILNIMDVLTGITKRLMALAGGFG
jgi:hypothetical protein